MAAQKAVVISGAFGVLGRAVAERFSRDGAQIACIDLSPVSPAHGAGDQALLIAGTDLANPQAAGEAVQKVLDRFGRIDALVNVAGGFRWQTVADAGWDLWERMLTMNLKTATNLCRASLPALLAAGNGSIVNVGAGAALKAAGGMGPYAASKAGVHRLTEALAEELKGKVRVNAVLPGNIVTEGLAEAGPDYEASMVASIPLRRLGVAADIGHAALYFASREAGYVTGQALIIDGGQVLPESLQALA